MSCESVSTKPHSAERAREFIADVNWTFAKTMVALHPSRVHRRARRGRGRFSAFVTLVRSGPIRRYRGGRYHCVTDEFDYFLAHASDAGWLCRYRTVCTAIR
jgi:hypothetical protein